MLLFYKVNEKSRKHEIKPLKRVNLVTDDLDVEKHSMFHDQEFTTNDKFTLDGKECINPGWQDMQKKSKAVWSDDKKSLKITTIFPMGDGGEMTLIEIFKMDGNNMVIDSSASSSYGDMSETIVYDKQ